MIATFARDETGRRPVFGDCQRFQDDLNWRDNLLFYEYFHGDTGPGWGPRTRPAGPPSSPA